MSETKAAFAERTKRSLNNTSNRHMEDYRYNYLYKMTEVVTTLKSRRKCLIDLKLKNIRSPGFRPFSTASHNENSED